MIFTATQGIRRRTQVTNLPSPTRGDLKKYYRYERDNSETEGHYAPAEVGQHIKGLFRLFAWLDISAA